MAHLVMSCGLVASSIITQMRSCLSFHPLVATRPGLEAYLKNQEEWSPVQIKQPINTETFPALEIFVSDTVYVL